MSLVDQNLIPFQTAYPMIIVLIVLVLAGNTAFVSNYLYYNGLCADQFSVSPFCEWSSSAACHAMLF